MLSGPLLERLRVGIAQLPPDQQRVYILLAREGLSVDTVAQIMELSSREVEHLLAKALVSLIHALEA